MTRDGYCQEISNITGSRLGGHEIHSCPIFLFDSSKVTLLFIDRYIDGAFDKEGKFMYCPSTIILGFSFYTRGRNIKVSDLLTNRRMGCTMKLKTVRVI